MRTRRYLRPTPGPLLCGYNVNFTYRVDGRTYDGVLDSPVGVEPGDRFSIRYNPDHPDENNSLGSKNSRASIASTIITIVLGALMLLLLIKQHLPHF